MNTITLTPAHGRDYKSRAAVLEDWHADKDFIIASFTHPYSGKPVNKSDLVQHGSGIEVRIRYNKLRRIALAEC